MKNFLQPGDVVTLTAPAAVTSGDVVKVGGIVGVAAASADNGASVEVKLSGVFELPKTSEQEWATVGLPIYWDADPGEVTTASTGNTLIGVNLAAAASPSATGIVKLVGAFNIPSAAQITAEITAAAL